MQLRHYAWIIWRGLWIILLGTVICAGATYAISEYIVTPVYQASTLIQVNPAGETSTVFSNQAQALNYSLLVTNNVVLRAAAKELPGMSISQLKDAVSASPLDNTSIIQIQAQADNPQLAAAIANDVGQIFIQVQVTNVTTALQSRANQISQLLTSAKNNVVTTQAQLSTLEKAHASTETIAHQVGILNDAQTNYDTLLLSYQQVQLQEIQVDHILNQAQRAIPPAAPISPRPTLNTAIAASMGLLLMTVFVLLLDWIDISIKTPEDIAQLTMLEPLGSVPRSKWPLILDDQQMLPAMSDGAVEREFTIIAMSIATQHKDGCAILITGLRPGNGTTTTASNLAISLAQLGKRVLLVDANLRRPSLHDIFQRPNTRGLLNSLTDVHQFREEVVQPWLNQWPTNIPNLWLLPTGPVAAHSEVALRSLELRILVQWLLGQNQESHSGTRGGVVDYIIFDTSTLQEGADPVIITSVTNYTILVVRAGKEQGEKVNKAGAIFQRLCSPVLGVIVNCQTAGHRPYFYSENNLENLTPGNSSLREPQGSDLSLRQNLSRNSPPSVLQVMGSEQNSPVGKAITTQAGGNNTIAYSSTAILSATTQRDRAV
jgi:polysaccharide biosynthesis transport protein